jgi:hypothetical protein
LGIRFTGRSGSDAREPLAQLDRGREFAPLLIDGADRSLIRLGDDEHRWSMGRHSVTGNCRQADARHHHGCGFSR